MQIAPQYGGISEERKRAQSTAALGASVDDDVIVVDSQAENFCKYFSNRSPGNERYLRINISASEQGLQAEKQRVEKILANTAGRIKKVMYVNVPRNPYFICRLFARQPYIINLCQEGILMCTEVASLRMQLANQMRSVFFEEQCRNFVIITKENTGKMHAAVLSALGHMQSAVLRICDLLPEKKQQRILVKLHAHPEFPTIGKPRTRRAKREMRAKQ